MITFRFAPRECARRPRRRVVLSSFGVSLVTMVLVWFVHLVDWRCRQVRAVAVQLMEVVHGVKDNEWLVKLLRGMISGPGAGDKQKKVHTVPRCTFTLSTV